ncbi:MAG: acyl-CoA dehydrogenase family protein [Halieaceae bacterium]|nr:acyl-CoA dehydrogenase family protein [Halieaceae bacterium]
MKMSDLASLGYNREVFQPEHEAFREVVRRFFQQEVEPNYRRWEKDGFFPAALFKTAAEYGILCSGIPEEYGGGGGDLLHQVILHEEHGFSASGASLEAGLCTELASYVLLDGGTEEQKKEWLPFFASGKGIAEVGLSEPGAGSDARAIKTFARRDGDDYVINGSKMWMSNGPLISVLFVVAKTETEGNSEAISMFIVPFEETKGITVSKPTPLMTKGCGGVSEIFFDGVRIPARNLVGGVEGRGLHCAMGSIATARIATAARCVAACELAMALTIDYTKERKAFGQRVFEFQNTQFKLASVRADIAAGRALIDSYLKKLNKNQLGADESAIAKLWASELEARVMDECLQLHGGMGYSDEMPISKMYSFARVHRIFLGTSEIMRSTIARSL